eukprot:Awhi_evm1s6630
MNANEGKQGIYSGLLPGSLREYDPSNWKFDDTDVSYSLDSFNVDKYPYENFLQ